MARKSTIAFAQKTLTPAQFQAYMQMPTKLSKSQLAAGALPPTLEELELAQAAQAAEQAAKKAAKAQASADACEAKPAGKGKRKAKKAKAPQKPEARLKIFDSLAEGFALYATVGGKVLAFEVAKVTPKTRKLTGAKGEAGKLTTKGGDVVLRIDGEAVELERLRYKAPEAVKPEAAAPEAQIDLGLDLD